MKKILLLIICITSLSVYAQQQGLDCKKTIGRVIENDEDYLYADKTAQNENTALADAKQTLRQVVSNYLISHQYDYSQGQLDMIMNNYPSICVIPRADKMRAFIYISIDDIKSVVKKVVANTPAQPETSEPEYEEDVFLSWEDVFEWVESDEGSGVSPTVTPKQATTDDEIVKSSAITTEPYGEIAISGEDESVVEYKPVVESSIDPEQEQEIMYQPAIVSNNEYGDLSESDYQFDGYEVVLGMKRKNQIFNYIKANNNGTYKPNVKASDTGYFLILYHRDGTIEAILSPRDARTGQRINLLTRKPDLITNHKGCAIDGFILSR